MDTGPQKESDTTGSKETKETGRKNKRKRKKKGISRLGQRDRWEITSIQAGRRQRFTYTQCVLSKNVRVSGYAIVPFCYFSKQKGSS